MLWQRLVFGSLMIAALAGLVAADAWLSAGLPGNNMRFGDSSDRFYPPPHPAEEPGADRQAAEPSAPAFHREEDPAATAGRAQPPPAAPAGTQRVMSGAELALRAGFLLTLLVALLAVGGVYELSRLCQAGGYQPLQHWAALVSLALVMVPWLDMLGRLGVLGETLRGGSPSALMLTVLAVGFIGTCVGMLARRSTQSVLITMGTTLFIILYIGLLAASAIGIRFLWIGPAGAAALVYFILTVKFGDIGAFVVGSAIGRHKLAPWLSPGKTWEGAAGAIVGSALMAEAGLMLWGIWEPWLGPRPLSAAQALVFGAFMAIFGHTGDLVESAIKRNVGVKDSGALIPAFGGLLDLLDSLLFTAPVAWGVFTLCVKSG